jgi:UDP-N-acetyl-D-mannosaminuronic acid dehydrogenase
MAKFNKLSHISLNVDENVKTLFNFLANRSFSNKNSGFALIIDSNQKLVGVVTDADIRKFLANNNRLPKTISEVTNYNFIYVLKNSDGINVSQEIVKKFSESTWEINYPVRFIPVIDNNGVAIDIIDSFDFGHIIKKIRDKVAVIGLGYVGLTVAIAMAKVGFNVLGIDSDLDKIRMLENSEIPMYEKGITEALQKLSNKNLTFSNGLVERTQSPGKSITFLICLPTSLTGAVKELDLTTITLFLDKLIPTLKQGDTIILRSTVPVGTSSNIIKKIENFRNWKVGSDFYFIYAPERTLEGNALEEISELPQVLSGASDACLEKGIDLFKEVCKIVLPVSSVEVAELIKVAGNAFRDYTFAFSNQLAEHARNFNIDVNEVIEKSNLNYPRSSIPYPSPGVGGPCLTKDSYVFANTEKHINPIVSARKYNESIPLQVVTHILKHVGNKELALCVGLAFKGYPPTDDLRNSTNVEISNYLKKSFTTLYEWDAVLESNSTLSFLKSGSREKFRNLDLLAILNNHPSNLDFCQNLLLEVESNTICLFDPWRMVKVNELKFNKNILKIDYLTLSMHREFKPT